MNDPTDSEADLRADLHDAAAHIVADEQLQRRLIDAATAYQPAASGAAARTSSRFAGSWLLPAAAAVVTLLTVGSVAVAQQLATGRAIPGAPERSSTSGARPTPTATVPMPLTTTRPTPATTPAPTTPPTTQRTAPSVRPSRVPSTSVPVSVSNPRSAVHAPPSARPSATHPRRPVATRATPTSGAPRSSAGSGRPATCSTPDSGEYVPTSLADFEQHITGSWLTCSEPSVFGTADAGLVIRADGTWAKLTRDASGHLVAGRSSLTKGEWVAVDTSRMNGRPTYQLNLHIDGSGTVIAGTHLSTGVNRLALDNNGVYEASYVPTSEPVN